MSRKHCSSSGSYQSSSILRITAVAIVFILAFHWYLVLHHVAFHAPRKDASFFHHRKSKASRGNGVTGSRSNNKSTLPELSYVGKSANNNTVQSVEGRGNDNLFANNTQGSVPYPQFSQIENHVPLSPMADDTELAKDIDGEIWLVSHGGVSSERFRESIQKQDKILGLPINRHGRCPGGKRRCPTRKFKDILAHFPYPLQNAEAPFHAPKLCIYIYGSVYESILSQLGGRHPDNPKKLHNDEAYPEFYNLKELLSHPDEDPFGIKSQFEHFLTANVRYPIVLVRYDAFSNRGALLKLESVVSELSGNGYNLTSLFAKEYKRKSSLETISNFTLREQFLERYSGLREIFEMQPLIRLLMPK